MGPRHCPGISSSRPRGRPQSSGSTEASAKGNLSSETRRGEPGQLPGVSQSASPRVSSGPSVAGTAGMGGGGGVEKGPGNQASRSPSFRLRLSDLATASWAGHQAKSGARDPAPAPEGAKPGPRSAGWGYRGRTPHPDVRQVWGSRCTASQGPLSRFCQDLRLQHLGSV